MLEGNLNTTGLYVAGNGSILQMQSRPCGIESNLCIAGQLCVNGASLPMSTSVCGIGLKTLTLVAYFLFQSWLSVGFKHQPAGETISM